MVDINDVTVIQLHIINNVIYNDHMLHITFGRNKQCHDDVCDNANFSFK